MRANEDRRPVVRRIARIRLWAVLVGSACVWSASIEVVYAQTSPGAVPSPTPLAQSTNTIEAAILAPVFWAALVAALSAVVVAGFNSWQQRALEQKKWEHATTDEYQRQVRTVEAELVRKMAELVQEISWLTWNAKYARRLDRSDVDNYNNRVREILPGIVAARVVLSTLNQEHSSIFRPLIKQLYDLDRNVANACAPNPEAPDHPSGGIGRSALLRQLGHRRVGGDSQVQQNGLDAIASYDEQILQFEDHFNEQLQRLAPPVRPQQVSTGVTAAEPESASSPGQGADSS